MPSHYAYDVCGRGFQLEKDRTEDSYDVRIGKPEECSCDCLRFTHHRHCKHVSGLLALVKTGQR
jgi:hypothetical protein